MWRLTVVSISSSQVSGTFQNVFNPPAPSPLTIANSEVKVEQSDVKVRKRKGLS